MQPPREQASQVWSRDSAFQNTLWTQVYAVGKGDAVSSRKALEVLCHTYWKPIYSFLKRTGTPHEDALDFTQGFFAYILERSVIEKADHQIGRFRTFLLDVLKKYVNNERRKQRARKRGGQTTIVSMDEEHDTSGTTIQPSTHLTPETEFDRNWALEVMDQAFQRLKLEYQRADSESLFTALQPSLSAAENVNYHGLAEQFGKTEEALRMQVVRFRKRYRALLRAVIADTLSDLSQVEEELEHFKRVLRGG